MRIRTPVVRAILTKGQLPNFIGKYGERLIEQRLGVELRQQSIAGIARRIDALDPMLAREVKTGVVRYGDKVLEQIAKDGKLVQMGYQVEWWLVKNPLTGATGIDERIIQAALQQGIRVIQLLE